MADLNEAAASADAATDETLDDVTVESTAPTVVTDEDSAASSPAAQATDAKPESILSVVRDAVKPKESGPSTDANRDHPTAAATAPEADNEDFKDVPFHKHPRFQDLVRERNTLREPAKRHQQLTSFLDENAMSGEDAATALNLFALMKRDPEAAWAEMKPRVQELLLQIGEILPADLRQQVTAGTMTPDVAKMVAKERAKANVLQGKQTFEQSRAARLQQNSAAQAAADLQESIVSTVRAWATAQRGKDIDFAKKDEDLQKEILFQRRQTGQVPKTPAEATAELDAALKAVNQRIRSQRPALREVRPVVGGGTATPSRAKPESLLDVVRQAGQRA
jgi:hypothetical protein